MGVTVIPSKIPRKGITEMLDDQILKLTTAVFGLSAAILSAIYGVWKSMRNRFQEIEDSRLAMTKRIDALENNAVTKDYLRESLEEQQKKVQGMLDTHLSVIKQEMAENTRGLTRIEHRIDELYKQQGKQG